MEKEKWALGPCSKGGVEWERDEGVRYEGRGRGCVNRGWNKNKGMR